MTAGHKSIVLAAGGTGGHVYPGIALSQEIGAEHCLFLCSEDRQDRATVERYGFSVLPVSSSPRNFWKIVKGIWQARDILKRSRCRVVVGCGGYHMFPIILAAASLRIPIVLLEQNAIPGKVTRRLSPLAQRIFLTYGHSQKWIPNPRTEVTGNPIRREFLTDIHAEALKQHLHEMPKPVILVMGGSQGAQAINSKIEDYYPYFLTRPMSLIHLTGPKFYENRWKQTPITWIRDANGLPKIAILPYCDQMDLLYAAADGVISRAGATTIAELEYFQKTMLLVPYPYATDHHQHLNAQEARLKNPDRVQWMEQDNFNAEAAIASLLRQIERSRPSQTPPAKNAREYIAQEIRHIAEISEPIRV